MLRARIRPGDDTINPLLVEALEALIAFKQFEVRSNRTLLTELLGLRWSDKLRRQQTIDTLRFHTPTLTGSETLAQMRIISERRHAVYAELFQLRTHVIEAEGRLQVVHAGFEERLAV